jgi:2-dehydropantoate 2-reductase
LRFAVIGVGGVGGYFGARLAEAGHDVTFVARGAHLAAIEASGLHVRSPLGDVHVAPARATDNPESVGVVDCVILGVKAWQVAEAARSAAPLMAPHTLVLPLQNGVEAPEQVAAALGREHALGGIAKIVSFLSAPGHVEHAGVEPSITLGALDARQHEPLERLCRALAAARGVSASIAPDIRVALWEKFLFITAWASVGAVTRAPAGVVRRLPETRGLMQSALGELERVARGHGVPLGAHIVAELLALVDSIPEASTASLQRDIASGYPSELDNLTGAGVRLAEQVDVAAPTLSFLLAALTPLEQRARGHIQF